MSTSLTTRDSRVLNLLFNSESQPGNNDDGVDVENFPTFLVSQINSDQLVELQEAERRAVQLAEAGLLEEAEVLLSAKIQKYPIERPSLWSNRAQVRRLAGDMQAALSDLSTAIRIATPPKRSRTSPDYSRMLSQAYTHRATIYLLAAREEIAGISESHAAEELEEFASRDFELAGRYGNELARAMAVRTNPYAKLCGAIVQTALMKEMGDVR